MASLPQRIVNYVWNVKNALIQRETSITDENGITRAKAVGFTGANAAGMFVDHDAALAFSAVWACVQVIAQDIGVLSWRVFERTDHGKQQVDDLPLSYILRSAPNSEMTAQTLREIMVAHCLLMGNAYAEIQRDGAGNPIALWPLLPDRTKPLRMPDGHLTYASWVSTENRWVEVPARDMFHLKGLGFNGLVGYDVISYMAQTVGTGLAAQRYSASFFGNGTHLSGGLFHKELLSPQAKENLREEFERVYRGPGNAFKMAIFEEGLEWKPFSVTPEAAKVIETRKHEIREVARWFRVKPHKIGDLDDATYANIENESIDHVGDTILPWAIRFEQEANRKLFTPAQKSAGMFTKLNIDTLKRGDMKSRYESYQVGRQWGWLNANDVLRLENMNEIGELGDIYLVPLNFQNAERLLAPDSAEQQVGRNQLASAIKPLAKESIERIHTRELHRVKDISKLDDNEFGRKLAGVMDKQSDYAAAQLNPVVSSALYVLFPNDGTIPVLVDRIVKPVVTAYLVRHGDRWRNVDRQNMPGAVDRTMINQMLDELFESITTESVQHEKAA